MKKAKCEQFSWRTISHLPTDTTTNIFSRLTLRDLLRTEVVCKDWHKTLTSNLQDCLVVCRIHNNCSKLYTVIHSVDTCKTPLKARRVFGDLPERFRIVGSSNGSVCVASMLNNGEFYVCNPVNCQTRMLPEPPSLEGHGSHVEPRDYFPCGFAFHETTDNYKVVYIFSSSTTVDNGVRTEIEICSIAKVGTPTWRRIEDHPSFVSRDASCTNSMVLLNGALHWLAKDTEFVSRHRQSGIIGVLDVANESPRILETPLGGGACTTLGALNDCLCICGELKDECKIWVMKDYDVESSWTIEYSFQKEILGPLHKLNCVNVVRRMSNGSVLLHCGGDQGYYDFEKDEFKEIVFDEITDSADYTKIIVHGLNLAAYKFLNF